MLGLSPTKPWPKMTHAMKSLRQPFKFPKKLWLALTVGCFVHLFLAVAVNLKGDQPTAWQELARGEIGMGVMFVLFWLIIASAFSAFAAAMFGILRALFWK